MSRFQAMDLSTYVGIFSVSIHVTAQSTTTSTLIVGPTSISQHRHRRFYGCKFYNDTHQRDDCWDIETTLSTPSPTALRDEAMSASPKNAAKSIGVVYTPESAGQKIGLYCTCGCCSVNCDAELLVAYSLTRGIQNRLRQKAREGAEKDSPGKVR
jgi:hypothetical protein